MEGQAVTILLLGDEKCGKTTFLLRISQGTGHLTKGPANGLMNIDQPFVFKVRCRNIAYRLEFYDNSGPGNWRLLKPDVVVVCYDVSQRPCLINAKDTWVKEVRANFEDHDSIPMLVLGLKRDLRREDNAAGVVYPQEGYRVAQEMRADKYMECSAVTGELLHHAFEDICTTAIKTTQQGGGQSEGGCRLM